MALKKKRRGESVAVSTAIAPGPVPARGGVRRALLRSVRLHLSRIGQIEAAYVSKEDDTFHIYSVMREYRPAIYSRLMKQEDLVEKDFPGVKLDFHTRASQGRDPSLAVPFGSQCAFTRQ
jgi:hypothetical protein